MRTGTVAIAFGIVLLTQLETLPDSCLVQFLPICVLVALFCPTARLTAWLACGFLWALAHAHWLLLGLLPLHLEGQELVVVGEVTGLPSQDPWRRRFDLDVNSTRIGTTRVDFAGRVRLNWYQNAPAVVPGERWQLRVRLKRPRGLVNPGGFDYELWLFRRGVMATGYVLDRAGNRRLGTRTYPGLTSLRYGLASRIASHFGDEPLAAVVAALAVGERGDMTNDQWYALRVTGTSHLMAISGLHIGLVAGLAFYLARALWSLGGASVLWIAAPRAAALVAMAAALVYAGLAGFSIPTQRALIMLTVLMVGVYTRRRLAASTSLATALAAVLVLDPFAVLSPGFWLSFTAVAVILLGMRGRVGRRSDSLGRRLWWQWGRVQWLVAIGLLPVTLALFLEYPLVAPVANLVAVPWTGFVVVPAVLCAVSVLLPFPELGGMLLDVSLWATGLLWAVIQWFADLELTVRAPRAPPGPILGAALLGAWVLILPRGVPCRGVALAWLVPLFLWPVPRPGPGDYWLTLLDVGQGLAVVVRTRRHTLLYDAGPRYRGGFDTGNAVVVPYLRHVGVRHVDRLILSHGHRDHDGGAGAVIRELGVDRLLTNVTYWRDRAMPCRAGIQWSWDAVEFLILHPENPRASAGNDASCVLKVVGTGGSTLLSGDIERSAETHLVHRLGTGLRADVLVVPHHGARTSSSPEFLDAVVPEFALISTGYRNRYGFPHDEVTRRLSVRSVSIYDTAYQGAITLSIGARGGIEVMRLEREAERRIWRAKP